MQFGQSLCENSGMVMSSLKLSVYDMVTGPSHFDYPLMKTGEKNVCYGRLTFDTKIFLKIKFNLQVSKIRFTLNEGLKSQRYNFNIKLKDGVDSYESEHSLDFLNPFLQGAAAKLSPKTTSIRGKRHLKQQKLETQEETLKGTEQRSSSTNRRTITRHRPGSSAYKEMEQKGAESFWRGKLQNFCQRYC
jgi:hypothetical protein